MNTVNDPKGEAGSKKAPMWLLPPVALEQTAWVHKLGNDKYGPFNWRKTGVCATTYVSAIMRHLNAWRDGEDLDPESGISHIAHVATSCNILMDAAACGTLQDDRNKRPARGFLDQFVAEFEKEMSKVSDEELVESFRELGCDVEIAPGKIEIDGKSVDLPPVPEGYDRWVGRGIKWSPGREARYQYWDGVCWSTYRFPLSPSGRHFYYIEAIKDETRPAPLPREGLFSRVKPGDYVEGWLVRGQGFHGNVTNILDVRGVRVFHFSDRPSLTEDEIHSITTTTRA